MFIYLLLISNSDLKCVIYTFLCVRILANIWFVLDPDTLILEESETDRYYSLMTQEDSKVMCRQSVIEV